MAVWQDIPKADNHSNSVRRRSSRQRHFPTISKRTRVFLRALLIIIAIIGLRRGFADLHDQLVKRHATDFTSLKSDQFIWPKPEQYVRSQRQTSIGDRYEHVRHLGSGNEGSADLYKDRVAQEMVVVKTVDGFLRNPIPRALSSDFSHHTCLWPTEIEAALLLRRSDMANSFLLLSDYFILERSPDWSWATVSPYSAGGTLADFARRPTNRTLSILDLDNRFRPNFNRLVRALRSLHDAQICHDDIKPDNIFVLTADEWLIGDVGNMREINHPWHATRSWARQNQLPDCRANDVRRLIKSYLWFLRAAVGTDAFDREFWRAETEWARIYWDFVRRQTSGRTPSSSELASPQDLARRTERELLCTTIPWQLWKPAWFISFWI